MDRSGRIHRPDHVDVAGSPQGIAGNGQRNRTATLVFLENREQLAEDPRDVTPVDLVDDEVEVLLRLLPGVVAQYFEDAIVWAEDQLVVEDFGPVTLEKVLVSVRGVERAISDKAFGAGVIPVQELLLLGSELGVRRAEAVTRGQLASRHLRPEGLAGSRWAVENDLLLALQDLLDSARYSTKRSHTIRRGFGCSTEDLPFGFGQILRIPAHAVHGGLEPFL